jgi:hypothetical protein
MKSVANIMDLTTVAIFGENIFIFVRKEDIDENGALALMYNTWFKSYYIRPLNKMLAIAAFEVLRHIWGHTNI